jgi:hypothetical protein
MAQYTFAKEAVIMIAPVLTAGTKPAANTFKELCMIAQIGFGFENFVETIANFCEKGNESEVASGGSKGFVNIGDGMWHEDYVATGEPLHTMEQAAINKTQVYMEIRPVGTGTGEVVYECPITVKKWEMTLEPKKMIMVKHDISTVGVPVKGSQA